MPSLAILPTGMFEKYTEAARRSVFMGRYEASQLGSGYIETEHLLLGILRMDKELALRLRMSFDKVDEIREQIEVRYTNREKISTSVDLPLSEQAKHVLHHADEEAKRRGHPHIGSEHLLLGISLEEKSFGAELLRDQQVTREELTAEVDRSTGGDALGATAAAPAADTLRERMGKARAQAIEERSKEPSSAAEPPHVSVRNLSAAARNGTLGPLIGREREIERIVRILSRRTRNNPVLVGEPGVGKSAIVEGVAQRIANCDVPASLADRPVFAIDASTLIAPSRRARSSAGPDSLIAQLTEGPIGILCVDGLLDLAASPGWGAVEATHVLEVLSRSGIQCLATGTPAGLRRSSENAGMLLRHFEVVEIAPASEEDAVAVLAGLKPLYEGFHDVVFADGVIEAAVFASGRFLPHRYLPDRALDLLDEAGARAKVRLQRVPAEERALQRRVGQLRRDMDDAIAQHLFDKAQDIAPEERQEREKLQRLRDDRKLAWQSRNTVTPADLEEAVAERAGVPVSAVQEVLGQRKGKESRAVAQKLAGAVPVEQQGWLPFLASYLAGCTEDDAERLAQAIREAKRG